MHKFFPHNTHFIFCHMGCHLQCTAMMCNVNTASLPLAQLCEDPACTTTCKTVTSSSLQHLHTPFFSTGNQSFVCFVHIEESNCFHSSFVHFQKSFTNRHKKLHQKQKSKESCPAKEDGTEETFLFFQS